MNNAREIARICGDKYYVAPCKHGHTGLRFTSTGQCRKCLNAAKRRSLRTKAGWHPELLDIPPVTDKRRPARTKRRAITWGGRTQSVSDWARTLGISGTRMGVRIKKFGITEKAFVYDKTNNNTPQLFTHDGRSMTARQWADELGITKSIFFQRRFRCPDRVFEPPQPRGNKVILYTSPDGETLTAKQWGKRIGITADYFHRRYRTDPERAFRRAWVHRPRWRTLARQLEAIYSPPESVEIITRQLAEVYSPPAESVSP